MTSVSSTCFLSLKLEIRPITLFGTESITGTVSYVGYKFDTGICIDNMSSTGIYANVFGSYEIMEDATGKGCIIFGLKFDYKFTRTEKGEVIINGISSKFDDSPEFSGFAIAPFIGYQYKK